MLSRELEVTLNLAFKTARENRHEFMTVEHLLLALLDDASASRVLTTLPKDACGLLLRAARYLAARGAAGRFAVALSSSAIFTVTGPMKRCDALVLLSSGGSGPSRTVLTLSKQW